MGDCPNILSLCTGVGGLDLGVELAVPGARVVCGVEREAYCCEVLGSRMEDEALAPFPVWSDLKTFDGKPWRGVVDLVTAGYPCQPFSTAGRRAGTSDERHLWPDVARVIGEVEPGYVLLENVGGHLRKGFEWVLLRLRLMGYEVAAGLFTAAEVGARHKRERLFALAANTERGGTPLEPGRCGRPGRQEAADNLGHGWWNAESEMGRAAHGIPTAVDECRALGNGVVPLQAAYAFVSLWAALHGDE